MNKTVLITGCSSGIGYETALKFAWEGWRTFASVRNLESAGAKNLEEIAKEEKLDLQVIRIDVTDDVSIREATQKIVHKAERIDCLVNNAGYGHIGPIEDFEIAEIEEQYNTNVFGILRMIKSVAPQMRKQKSGTIINISSVVGLVPPPFYGIYSSSKFALESLSEVLNFELARFGIKVIIIEPGVFLSNFPINKKVAKKALRHDSIYYPAMSKLSKRLGGGRGWLEKSFLSNLVHPRRVANLIYKTATTDNPKLRYKIGPDTHAQHFLHRLLPNFLWHSLLHRAFQW